MHVDWIGFTELKQLLQGFVDENDANERSKGFLSKARDVADQGTRVGGHENDAECCGPEPNAGP